MPASIFFFGCLATGEADPAETALSFFGSVFLISLFSSTILFLLIGLIVFILFFFRYFAAGTHGLAGISPTGSRIGFGSLTIDRQTPSVTHTSISLDVFQSLYVSGNF